MKTPYEPRHEPTSAISYYIGDTSQRVRLMYGLLLILFALILLVSSWVSKQSSHLDIIDSPTIVEVVKLAFASYPSTQKMTYL